LDVSGDEDTSDNTLSIAVHINAPVAYSPIAGDVVLEIENFTRQSNLNQVSEGAYNSAWFLNSSDLQPTITPDFDTTPANSASGDAYVELLPDTRTGEDDPPLPGISNFATADQSPTLHVDAFFSEAGQYTVFARIRSNNEQDNSIYVGLNSQWPDVVSTISVCNADGNWEWTQRTTENNVCVSDSVTTIDIAEPGQHTINIAAATDGVELDKLVLRKDNTETPIDLGPEANSYAPENIDLSIVSEVSEGTYQIEVFNPDTAKSAGGILVTLEGLPEDALSNLTGFDSCTSKDDMLNCVFDSISSNSARVAELPVSEDIEQTFRATLVQANDPDAQNNSTTASITGVGSLGLMHLLLLLLASSTRLHRRR
ncbi:MAG: hypothetical protein AAF404_21720, partial [Pseudomonadota bacterium]